MFPFCRECADYDEAIRLTPQECGDYFMQILHRQKPAGFQAYVRDAGIILSGGCFQGHDSMNCRAGRSSFWINWKGEMSPCFALQQKPVSLTDYRFAEAWKQIGERISSVRLSEKCSSCRWQRLCMNCAGRACSETGHPDGTPTYLCTMMEHIKKGFHEA